MNARETALTVLLACRKQGAWSDSAIPAAIARGGLDRRDAALASRLCYGVIQNKRLLDWHISRFLNRPIRDLQPVVLDVLRLGAYQIICMDRIPDSAAVNEAVEQAKRHANRQAAGLVNGVLRSMSRGKPLPEPEDLATRYSHSPELVELLRQNVGEKTLEPLLRCHNETPPTTLQINSLRTDVGSVRRELENAGAAVQTHPRMEDCLLLSGGGGLGDLPCFRRGEVYVQDPAARMAVLAADPRPGMRVLDCCAAPGGKSFAAAVAMEDRGEIVSCDLSEGKIRRIREGADRLGLAAISAMVHDARTPEPSWEDRFDLVICDAPCSGLGVIRKKPDIREKDLSATERLPELQLEILSAVSRYVRPGGVLLYSTCTILRRENEDVTAAFLRQAEDFRREDFSVCGLDSTAGMLTLLPCIHDTDGFFMAKMRKLP